MEPTKAKGWESWHRDPRLTGRFHPDYPNDVEALFLDRTLGAIEKLWVSLIDLDLTTGHYVGVLLGEPTKTKRVCQGTRVMLRMTAGAREPIFIGDIEGDNLRNFRAACSGCGSDVLFDPAVQAATKQFGGLPTATTMDAFTTHCALCDGEMLVMRRGAQADGTKRIRA